MERTTVRRTAELDCDAATLWHLVSAAEGLDTWLGEDVHLDLRVGGAGRLVDDDGVARDVRVTELIDGQRLAFTWWPDGDDGVTSDVVFTVEETDTGSRLLITETAAYERRVLATRVVSLWLAVCSLARV